MPRGQNADKKAAAEERDPEASDETPKATLSETKTGDVTAQQREGAAEGQQIPDDLFAQSSVQRDEEGQEHSEQKTKAADRKEVEGQHEGIPATKDAQKARDQIEKDAAKAADARAEDQGHADHVVTDADATIGSLAVPSNMNSRSIPGVHRDHLHTDLSRAIGIDSVPHGPKSLNIRADKHRDHEVFAVPETQESSAPANPPMSTGDRDGVAQAARIEARNERIAQLREEAKAESKS